MSDVDIGIGVHEDNGASAVVDALRARLAGLRTELAELSAAQADVGGGSTLTGMVQGAETATSAINQTIGAFVKLGAAVDASNAKAVAAFREEADATAVYLQQLGATEAEINRVGAAAARLEQRAGATRFGQIAPTVAPPTVAPPGIAQPTRTIQAVPTLPQVPIVPVIPPVPPETISSFEQVAPKMRTAANALALLAIAAETGDGSLRGVARAAGTVTIAIGTMVAGPIGGLITALGAIATLATVAFGLYEESQKKLDATLHAQDEAAQSRLARIAGEDAAQAAAITRQADREKEAVEKGKGFAKQKAEAIAAIEKDADEKRATLEKNRVDKQKKDVDAAIDASQAANDKLLRNDEQQATLALEREIAARRRALEKQLGEAQQDPNADRAKSRVDALTVELQQLGLEEADSIAKITKDSAEARTKAERDANANILDLIGQSSAAATLRIRQQYDELLKNLIAKGVANAQNFADAFFNAQTAKAAIDKIERDVTTVFAKSDNEIARTNALLGAHAITISQARDRVVAALEAERAAVEASIGPLEQQAEALGGIGNPEVLAKLDAAKTKLLELSLAVDRAKDQFADLKDTARSASESALSGFLQGLTKLGTQDRTQINALSGELKGAQQELNALLAVPSDQRTDTQNTRITQLRQEIAQTTVGLDNAKRAITTWRDLFVSAIGSVVDALTKTVSDDLARAAIDLLTGVGKKPAASTASAATSGAALTAAASTAATTLATAGTTTGSAISTGAAAAQTSLVTGATAVTGAAQALDAAAAHVAEAAAALLAAARASGNGGGFTGPAIKFGSDFFGGSSGSLLSGGSTSGGIAAGGTALASLSPGVPANLSAVQPSLSRIPQTAAGGAGSSQTATQTYVFEHRLDHGFIGEAIEKRIQTPEGHNIIVRIIDAKSQSVRAVLSR